jgi:hypothetical protein
MGFHEVNFYIDRFVIRIRSHWIVIILDNHNGRFSSFSTADRFPQNMSIHRRQHNNPQPIQEFRSISIMFWHVKPTEGCDICLYFR